MKDKNKIAEWYAEEVMQHSSTPYDEIEWLVMNLNDDAMNTIADYYQESNNENK